MSNLKLSNTVLENINSFRTNPISAQRSLQISSKAMSKSKNTEGSRMIEEFLKDLGNYSSLKTLSLSKGLSKAAEEHLKRIVRGKNIITNSDLNSFIKPFIKNQKNLKEVNVEGDIEFVVSLIVSGSNKSNNYISSLINENGSFIGVACAEVENFTYTVLYFADSLEEIEDINYGEDQELKEAFDLFDIYSTGKLDEIAVKEAFIALGLEKDNYCVYSSILNLNGNNNVKKQGGVDWETFRDTVKDLIGDLNSKEGIKKVFELFIDDPKQDTITSDSLKKLSRDLGDDLSNKEISEIMKRAAENGADIGFDEFYKIMMEYKELHPSQEQ